MPKDYSVLQSSLPPDLATANPEIHAELTAELHGSEDKPDTELVVVHDAEALFRLRRVDSVRCFGCSTSTGDCPIRRPKNAARACIAIGLAVVSCFAIFINLNAFGTQVPSTGHAGSNRSDDPHRYVLQRLGFSRYDEESPTEESEAETTAEGMAAQLKLPQSQCKHNTFFIDWGSSGAKVYLVHAESSDAAEPLLPKKVVKRRSFGPNVPSKDLFLFLDALRSRIRDSSAQGASPLPTTPATQGAALATAGFRLHPDAANATWRVVRKWNSINKLFKFCDHDSNNGCRTIAGSEEARYELASMVDHAHKTSHERQKAFGSTNFGLAACGGASIQLGISGASKDKMRQCHKDLSPIDVHYDADRLDVIEKQHLFLLSFLADNGAQIKKDGLSDYMVGGVDQMRGRYDMWLRDKGHDHNPCVPKETSAFFTSGARCLQHYDQKKCLLDRFGSYITSLPGLPQTTHKMCRESVKKFVDDDLLMSRWRHSSACLDLAGGVEEWGFVSSFSREAQLGHDVSKPTKWNDVRTCITAHDPDLIQEAEEDMKAGFFGKVLTSTMLVTILDTLGLNPEADVRSSSAEPAVSAMANIGLRPGWIEKC